jgi:hypothetical protein
MRQETQHRFRLLDTGLGIEVEVQRESLVVICRKVTIRCYVNMLRRVSLTSSNWTVEWLRGTASSGLLVVLIHGVATDVPNDRLE